MENVIQGACQGALQAYFYGACKPYTQFSPYSNQQSPDPNRTNLFAADVIGIIEDSSLLMLEMKYYDCLEESLPKFEPEQHKQLMSLEDMGAPIQYCYNSTAKDNIAYFNQRMHPHDWPGITLNQLHVSAPSFLPDRKPYIQWHSSLLSWVMKVMSEQSGQDNFRPFATLLNGALQPGQVRNQFITLIYSHKRQHMVGMDENGIKEFLHWIITHPSAQSLSIERKANQIKQLITPAVQTRILNEVQPARTNTQNINKNPSNDNDNSFTL